MQMGDLDILSYLECGPAVASNVPLIEEPESCLLSENGNNAAVDMDEDEASCLEIHQLEGESGQELNTFSVKSIHDDVTSTALSHGNDPVSNGLLNDSHCIPNDQTQHVIGRGWDKSKCTRGTVHERTQADATGEVEGRGSEDMASCIAEKRYEETWEILSTIESLIKDSIGLPQSELLIDCSPEELDGIPKDLLEALKV